MNLVQKLESLSAGRDEMYYPITAILFEKEDYYMSIQASRSHYCIPRENLKLNEYTHFEVMAGVPKEDVPSDWEEYSDGYGVYGFVPKEKIEELLVLLDKKYQII